MLVIQVAKNILLVVSVPFPIVDPIGGSPGLSCCSREITRLKHDERWLAALR